MSEGIEFKGKNVGDAVEMAVKHFKTSKENIKYEVIEETNKTLFSILAPKYAIIKAEIIDESKVTENKEEHIEYKSRENNERVEIELSEEEKHEIEKSIYDFLEQFSKAMNINFDKEIKFLENNIIDLKINGKESACLIGYRGEILDALQTILKLISSNSVKRYIKIQVDIENYREKRKDTLENLAKRIAENVVRTGKKTTLEPMVAYERKIIHNALQSNCKVETTSIGEEPYRRVVVSLKK